MEKIILVKTAISCMASDGSINQEELKTLHHCLGEIGKDALQREVELFNATGKKYLKDYIDSLSDYRNDNDTILSILKIAVDIIKADNVIDYKEICFFKLIVNALNLTEQFVLDNIDGIDEDWVEEDFLMTKEEAYNKFFSSYITPDFDVNLNNLQ